MDQFDRDDDFYRVNNVFKVSEIFEAINQENIKKILFYNLRYLAMWFIVADDDRLGMRKRARDVKYNKKIRIV